MIEIEVYKYVVIQTTLGEMTIVNEEDGAGKVIAQWFPIRAQCDLLGLDADRQKRVVREDYAEALREIPIELAVGWRRLLCIRKRELALWIAGIDPSRCHLATALVLEDYRQELLAAADRIFWKHATPGNLGTSIVPVRSSDVTSDTTVEIRAIGLCPCCSKPTRVLIADGYTVLSHVDDLEAV